MLYKNDKEPCILPFIVNEIGCRVDACSGWIDVFHTEHDVAKSVLKEE